MRKGTVHRRRKKIKFAQEGDDKKTKGVYPSNQKKKGGDKKPKENWGPKHLNTRSFKFLQLPIQKKDSTPKSVTAAPTKSQRTSLTRGNLTGAF